MRAGLPDRVIDAALLKLRRRVARIVRLLNHEQRAPLNVLAHEAQLIGECAWLLDPFAMADAMATKHALAARREHKICVWDGECEADATSDDGLCAAHAEEQAREEAETEAEVAALEQVETAGEDAG